MSSVDLTSQTEALALLDFEPTLPCEHPNHPVRTDVHAGPAALIIRRFFHCPREDQPVIAICQRLWDASASLGVRCPICGEERSRDEAWMILQRINGGAS